MTGQRIDRRDVRARTVARVCGRARLARDGRSDEGVRPKVADRLRRDVPVVHFRRVRTCVHCPIVAGRWTRCCEVMPSLTHASLRRPPRRRLRAVARGRRARSGVCPPATHRGPARGSATARSPSPQVLSRDITEWDEFTGRLEAVNTVDVRPRVSGYVSAVRFQEGTLVAAATRSSRSTPARSRPRSIASGRAARARATVRARDVRAPARRAPGQRERDVARGARRRAGVRRGIRRAGRRRRGGTASRRARTSSSRGSPRRSTAASAAPSSPRATSCRADPARRRC